MWRRHGAHAGWEGARRSPRQGARGYAGRACSKQALLFARAAARVLHHLRRMRVGQQRFGVPDFEIMDRSVEEGVLGDVGLSLVPADQPAAASRIEPDRLTAAGEAPQLAGGGGAILVEAVERGRGGARNLFLEPRLVIADKALIFVVNVDADGGAALEGLGVAVGDDRIADLGGDRDAAQNVDKLERRSRIDATSRHAVRPNLNTRASSPALERPSPSPTRSCFARVNTPLMLP